MSDMLAEKSRTPKPHRRHFVRTEVPKPIRVELRDREIIRAVARFRFLSSHQIARLFAQPIEMIFTPNGDRNA